MLKLIKFLIPIFGLCLFVLGVIVFIVWSKNKAKVIIPGITTEISVDWQIYKNERFGFTIRYPRDWLKQEDSSRPAIDLYPPTNTGLEKNKPHISVNVLNLSFSEALCSSSPEQASYAGLRDRKKITVDEVQGCSFLGEGNEKNPSIYGAEFPLQGEQKTLGIYAPTDIDSQAYQVIIRSIVFINK